MSQNYFRGQEGTPYHLSVGAVLIDSGGKIIWHNFDKIHGVENIYLLMRETLEPNETFETGLACGLIEEFGAICQAIDYLGLLIPTENEKIKCE